jgi:segregation and condensation protein A
MFQIEIEGFSGPLDLLCHLIDQKEIEASQISVSQVISIYVAYLAKTEKLSISAAADFISQAAHLVRQKTFSLLPQYHSTDENSEEEGYLEDQDLPQMIERYRPYRKAAAALAELKEKADKRRLRRADTLEPFFDLGDLYSLSRQWLLLLNKRRQQALNLLENESFEDDGVPAEIPEEVQVENRMSRILERLEIFPDGLTMSLLLREEPGRSSLVVTLLALLELSRRNRVVLLQKELFGDVFITARNR